MIKQKNPNITGAYFEYKPLSNTDPVKQVKKSISILLSIAKKTFQHLTSGIFKKNILLFTNKLNKLTSYYLQ